MSKHSPIIVLFLLFASINMVKGQVSINTTGAAPDNSAILDIQSNNKGLLIPRMTTSQINAMANPVNGLIVFDTKKGMTVYNAGRGWLRMEAVTPGRIYVSETYPDTLYPYTDYDYLGVFFQSNAFRKNFGTLNGGWLTKSNIIPMSNKKALYTGSVSNKVVILSGYFEGPCDSCIAIYNPVNDSLYKDPIGNVRRFGLFTATMDTSNARIFVWGGESSIEPFTNPEYRGYIYYYNTATKVIMDSVTMPSIRFGHSAVWAKSVNKLLVFGGKAYSPPNTNLGLVNTLFAYDPATNTWSPLTTSPLSARWNHIALYDGNDKMIIWGGDNGSGTEYTNGAVYTISTNTWSMISSTGAPTRKVNNGSWTGTEMLLSSQNVSMSTYDYLAYRYNLGTDTWTAIPPIPSYLGKPSIVWSDHFWSGSNLLQMAYLIPYVNTPTTVMWSYDLVTNSWTPLAGPTLNPQESATGVDAGNAIIFINNVNNKFFRYKPEVAGTPSYQVTDQEFHYYKKK